MYITLFNNRNIKLIKNIIFKQKKIKYKCENPNRNYL